MPHVRNEDVQDRKELAAFPEVDLTLLITAVARLPHRVHSNPVLPRLEDPRCSRLRFSVYYGLGGATKAGR